MFFTPYSGTAQSLQAWAARSHADPEKEKPEL